MVPTGTRGAGPSCGAANAATKTSPRTAATQRMNLNGEFRSNGVSLLEKPQARDYNPSHHRADGELAGSGNLTARTRITPPGSLRPATRSLIMEFPAPKGEPMKKILWFLLVGGLLALPAQAGNKETDRVENSGRVLKEILNIPDNIPQELLDKAECVIVIPSVLKFAIGFGGSYGRGVMTCRTGQHFTGPWSAPSMIALEGGSFGLQLGGDATDFVLLVMNQRGAESIMSSKVKLGAERSEEHTSELQSRLHLVCRLLLEKKNE